MRILRSAQEKTEFRCIFLRLFFRQIKRMMTTDPAKRIQIGQVRLHPWLKDPHMRAKVTELVSSYEQENNSSEGSRANEPPAGFDEPEVPIPKRVRRR